LSNALVALVDNITIFPIEIHLFSCIWLLL